MLDFMAVHRMRSVRRSGDETIFLLIIEISASIMLFTTPNTSRLFSVQRCTMRSSLGASEKKWVRVCSCVQ